jgi:hypothetical protein
LGVTIAKGDDFGFNPASIAVCKVDAITNHGMTIQSVDFDDETGDACDTSLDPKWRERPKCPGRQV